MKKRCSKDHIAVLSHDGTNWFCHKCNKSFALSESEKELAEHWLNQGIQRERREIKNLARTLFISLGLLQPTKS